MKDTFDEQLIFVKKIGFKTPALAIAHFGIKEYRKQFVEFKKSEDKKLLIDRISKDNKKKYASIIPEKGRVIRKHRVLNQQTTIKKKINMLNGLLYEGGKCLFCDENYIIFPDGRLYSIFSYKFLNPVKQKDRKGHFYLSYSLRNKKTYTLSRLVYFHFGNHKKKNPDKLKRITYIDNNPENCHISNLRECTQMEINAKIGNNFIGAIDKTLAEKYAKLKISEKESVQKLLSEGVSQAKISKMYNVSPSAISRYVVRHDLIKQPCGKKSKN